ncbi:hypothetical protein [Paraburkholderia humisilvae]|uniref:hypothetical protein n=1 Tax=Paraburkholderia humisilvae TaxID=627669 RepID=UPI0015834C38|nr:hypothetical protein [Paraburkholderia humisilvae]
MRQSIELQLDVIEGVIERLSDRHEKAAGTRCEGGRTWLSHCSETITSKSPRSRAFFLVYLLRIYLRPVNDAFFTRRWSMNRRGGRRMADLFS